MRTKKLTTRRFLFEEGKFVIAHCDPDEFVVKAVPPWLLKRLNFESYWVRCGYGQEGWTRGLYRMAEELRRQAFHVGQRQPRQHNLFGSPEDQDTAEAFSWVKSRLDGED